MNKLSLLIIIYFLCNNLSHSQELEPINTLAKEQADIYLKDLQVHYKNGDYKLHKAYSDSLLGIAKQHKFTKMHILALINQGIYFKNRSEQQKTIELYHQALELCKHIPEDFRTKTIVLVNMGNSFQYRCSRKIY
ncbi:hypothetical protein [uncultured Algibacter sp.]|uniref:hypothetical protein n=1 Tax=uncultured Algibacter sp. TaxID=298659 RepID=UPI003217A89D